MLINNKLYYYKLIIITRSPGEDPKVGGPIRKVSDPDLALSVVFRTLILENPKVILQPTTDIFFVFS